MVQTNTILALGAEAVSFAAIDSGVKGVFGYPGTPSTEVFESAEALIESMNGSEGRIARWAANEKVAYEWALGASYAGHRTIATMKHVGLNVAMDPFVNSAMTGVNGGCVIVVADDPSMHSSQNEQDNRLLADFAILPCFEPSTVQETYNMTCKAFDVSEKLKLPVLLRLVTRLAHSRSTLVRQHAIPVVEKGIPQGEDAKRWVLIPARARTLYLELRAKVPRMIQMGDELNTITKTNSKTGVIMAGMGAAYFNQVKVEDSSLQSVSTFQIRSYPVNPDTLREFADTHDTVYVFEEDYPYLEDMIRMMFPKKTIHGRRDNAVNFSGELSPLAIRKAMHLAMPEHRDAITMPIPDRLPRLCDGCGHADAFKAIMSALENNGVKDPRIFGDIGCYTLGVQPPFNAIHTCVEMGGSIGLALGAAFTGYTPAVAVLGDSTFYHSALPTLVSLARSKVNANLMVMDNRIVGMTGQQMPVAVDSIEDIVKGAGIPAEHIHVLIPLPKNHAENTAVLQKVFAYDGPSVVIFKRECIQSMKKGIHKK